MSMTPAGPAAGAQSADMFLHVQSARAGKIKGEAVAPEHVDDIVLSGWRWGIKSPTAMGTTAATARRAYTALTVIKQLDCASTGLMSALVTNADIKEVLLTMRRTGGEHEAFFTMKLKGARVIQVEHDVAPDGAVNEVVGISFTHVEVEYRRQQASGLRGAASTFSDQLPGAD